MTADISIYPNAASLAQTAAEQIVTLAAEVIHTHKRFSIGLSGGSTPHALYALLAAPEFSRRIDWQNVHVFWGDERCVPPDHPDSNYRMARETLLDHVSIPASHVYRIHGEIEPPQAAADYEQTLRAFFGQDATPRFDLLLLGMGDDGHTASLFPGTAALNEDRRWVVENHVAKLNTWRITLTPVVLNAADQVWFLVAGENKAATLNSVLNGPYQPEKYPSQLVRAHHLHWMIDSAAAERL